MEEIKNHKQGFTLLELLVVVLIIGILASIALPQYDKAVTKARLAEVLINVKAIEGSIDRYLLKNGFPSKVVGGQDLLDIELSGGEWDNNNIYHINKNYYDFSCSPLGCGLYINNEDSFFMLVLEENNSEGKTKTCYTNESNKGRFICKYLEPLGWEYIDDYY